MVARMVMWLGHLVAHVGALSLVRIREVWRRYVRVRVGIVCELFRARVAREVARVARAAREGARPARMTAWCRLTKRSWTRGVSALLEVSTEGASGEMVARMVMWLGGCVGGEVVRVARMVPHLLTRCDALSCR